VKVRVDEGNVATVEIPFSEGIVASGVVVNRRGEPVYGAQVMVLPSPGDPRRGSKGKGSTRTPPARPQRPRPVANTTSDGNGSFSISELPAGKYVLVVNHQDFIITQESFEIRDGGMIREFRIQLKEGEWLNGTVYGADGSVSAGAMVWIRDAGGMSKRTRADGLGRYEIRGLLAGKHTLSVFSPGNRRPESSSLKIKKGENRFDFHLRQEARRR
jgi:hypothetical protein